jgi:hypothetical protein
MRQICRSRHRLGPVRPLDCAAFAFALGVTAGGADPAHRARNGRHPRHVPVHPDRVAHLADTGEGHRMLDSRIRWHCPLPTPIRYASDLAGGRTVPFPAAGGRAPVGCGGRLRAAHGDARRRPAALARAQAVI